MIQPHESIGQHVNRVEQEAMDEVTPVMLDVLDTDVPMFAGELSDELRSRDLVDTPQQKKAFHQGVWHLIGSDKVVLGEDLGLSIQLPNPGE